MFWFIVDFELYLLKMKILFIMKIKKYYNKEMNNNNDSNDK